jgi:hypothetical protein
MNDDIHLVYGIHITDRVHKAGEVQKVLTEYGCNIKTRIGLHHVDDKQCSPQGLILLEMFGDEAACEEMGRKLSAIAGVEVQKMRFTHP